MNSALIVIDVQKHFAVENAKNLPEKIAAYIKQSSYDYVLFTVFRNDPSSNFHKILHHYGAMNKPDIDIHPALEQFSNDRNTFTKLTYSVFKAPGFTKFLSNHQVKEIDLCGINIDGCVLASAYEAFDLGYKVRVLEDLSSVSSERQDYINAAEVIITRNLKRKAPK